MMVNKLHLVNPDIQEVYARQYQCTLFDWNAAEVMKALETRKKTLEKGKILLNIKVIFNDLKILKYMLNLDRTL